MRKPVIAIDGYSSTGKSSISKVIAEKLGLIHLDTGALYRGITLFGLQNFSNGDGNVDVEKLLTNLSDAQLEFRNINDVLVLFLNGKDISNDIRSQIVSSNVSVVAKQKEVRQFLLETQRSIAENGGVILDGRDIGTVVLPNADFKFFLTASINERTIRRFNELRDMGMSVTEDEVRTNLIERDKIDSEREVAPLKQAEDAIVIDNSNMTKEETIESIINIILGKI
jgi:cytidylate kinase